MTTIRVIIPGPPIPKARPRFAGRGSKRVYTPERTANYEAAVGLYARREMNGEQPYDCPMEMRVQFIFEPPPSWLSKSKKKYNAALRGLVDCTNACDVDNLCKAVCDSVNRIVYNDDHQIVHINAFKSYGPKAMTIVEFVPRIRGKEQVEAA